MVALYSDYGRNFDWERVIFEIEMLVKPQNGQFMKILVRVAQKSREDREEIVCEKRPKGGSET